MNRASNTFSVLQAAAAVVGLAIILWSFGLPSFRFAEAANVTSFSDTLSTAQPSVGANHTIEFVSPSGVASGEAIVLTFDPDGQAFNLTGVGEEDVDLLEDGVAESVGSDWLVSVNTTADTITITSQGAGGVIDPGATTTILVGTHATNDGSPDTQIINPTADTYEIGVDIAGETDTGFTRVAIIENVTVSASVDTVFDFTVTGVASGQTVNGTTTATTTTATAVNFGTLDAGGAASTAAQDLTVVTNARNGFTVSVVSDGQLDSATLADIDGFANGNYTSSPTSWSAPLALVGSEETYGHWGLTSDDADIFAATETYVSASTTPVQIFTHDGPTDGTGAGEGVTRVGYTVQISSLQEGANDYSATLTYVATPVF